MVVGGGGDIWGAAGPLGGPTPSLRWSVWWPEAPAHGGSDTLYAADALSHGRVVLDRCGCSGAQRARTGGLGGICKALAAPARNTLKRNLFPVDTKGGRAPEFRPPSVATRRHFGAGLRQLGRRRGMQARGPRSARPAHEGLCLQAYDIPLVEAEAWTALGTQRSPSASDGSTRRPTMATRHRSEVAAEDPGGDGGRRLQPRPVRYCPRRCGLPKGVLRYPWPG